MRLFAISSALLLLACGPADRESPSSGNPDGGQTDDQSDAGDPPVTPDGSPPSSVTAVFAHSDAELYRVDPDSLDIELVGPFAWPSGSDQMTDIAIDKTGLMIGISFDQVYSVDADTALTTYLADLDRSFNGLSFVSNPAGGDDLLLAAALDGSIYSLDPNSGTSTMYGNYGGGVGSSGDLVSVDGFGTAATVTTSAGGFDRFATVELQSGLASVVGDTGYSDIWGLGYWADEVFGFASDGTFVLIDVNTGVATTIEQSNVSWWGAGVTTQADVTVD